MFDIQVGFSFLHHCSYLSWMCRRLVAFDRLTITLGWDIWTFFPPKWWDLTSWTLKMGRKKSRTNCNFSKLLLQFIRVYFVPPLPNNLPLGSRAWWERKLNISTILILCQWHEQCKWNELLKIESFDTSDVASSFAQWNSSETANCTIYWTRILTWKNDEKHRFDLPQIQLCSTFVCNQWNTS